MNAMSAGSNSDHRPDELNDGGKTMKTGNFFQQLSRNSKAVLILLAAVVVCGSWSLP